MKNPRLKDHAGQRFGRWLVLKQAGNTRVGGALWLCHCDCGTEKAVQGADLRSGRSTSCGCFNGEVASKRFTTHGGTGTRLYRIWKAMKTRCGNSNVPTWKNYGGRGIRIAKSWERFENFREWAASSGYKDGLSIDRIDNDLGYGPDNCKWSTYLQQSVNRRFVLKDDSGNAWSQIAKKNGIKVALMHSRIHDGWPIEKAATFPLGSRLKDL